MSPLGGEFWRRDHRSKRCILGPLVWRIRHDKDYSYNVTLLILDCVIFT